MRVRQRSVVLLVAVLFGVVLFMSLDKPAMRADDAPPATSPVEGRAVAFAISLPITDLPPEPEVEPPVPDENGEVPDEEMERRLPFRPEQMDAGAGSVDPAIFPGGGAGGGSIEGLPQTAMPSPLVNFLGLSTADNGSTVLPPDTVGDVGPNHYVQMTNVRFRIWDKAGNALIPARSLASLFAPLGSTNRCSNVNDGDPVVVYDPMADRWLLSQFCNSFANPNNHQLVAISTTGDPTGSYYLYDFMMPNNKFNDYPHFAVWPDGYYMTDHQFNQAGTAYLGQGVFALNRMKMLAGDPTANYVYFDLAPLDPDIGGMLASDMDGLNPPPLGSPAYFMNWRADEYGDPFDFLQIFEFHADFAHPGSSTFIQRPESHMPVPAFDPRVPTATPQNCIEQPGAAAGAFLDAIQDRFMHRLAYRNFGGQESLVVTHTVNVGPNPLTVAGHQAGIRYYELRRNLPGGPFFLNNAATYAPDSDNRWMGSAAQDNQGNIAIGYSVSSSTVSPSVRFAGRLASDPPNGLFQGETTLIAGTGRQTSNSGRWGDYSSMSVDPADDCTFWYTQEYYASISSVNWFTRIGSFKFPSCVASARGTLQGTITDCSSGLPITGVVVQATGGFMRATGAGGAYSMTTVPGTYSVSATRAGYQPASAAGYVVGNGAATTADLCLAPVSIVATSGSAVVTAESCGPGTGALDPGETVSVAFTLRNTGAAATGNLVATLLAGGGVLAPGAPQSYGALPAGGGAVSRTFDFTVDPNVTCGGSIVATLSLNDGGADLGTVTFNLNAGQFWSENFDGQASPLLPPGWTDSSVGGTPPPAWAGTSVVGYFVSAPNGVATGSSASVSERRLDSPVIPIPTLSTQLTFRNNFSLQTSADGGVLEISINGGAFADIIANGGLFLSGGYNGTINATSGSPIGGRAAWTGANTAGSNGFITTKVILPPAALGQNVRLRWRAAFNNATSTTGGGWRIDDVALATTTCCGSILVSPQATVSQESCDPANLGIDPDETTTVAFPILDVGTAPTTNLVATLLPGGGVFAPSGPQSYGVLTPNGPIVSRLFTFVPAGVCGGSITATLALQDGAVDLGTRAYTLTLGGTRTIFTENFDNQAAPALPPGWVATQPLGSSLALWATSTTLANRVSPPNGAITPGSGSQGDNRLDSPSIPIPAGVRATLSFNNNWSLEDGFDGGVLEISISGGPFTDIVAAGGSFVTGGYTGAISVEAGGPLAGRPAWTGSSIFGSNGFVVTQAVLPPAVLGTAIKLRWRAGFDASGNPAGSGWRIDDVAVSVVSCCSQTCALGCPADLVTDNAPAQCGASVSFSAATLAGNCGTVAAAPASGSFFAVGSTQVTSTGTSVSGAGTTGSCSFNVQVNDVENPSIGCPADIVVPTDAGLCSAVVGYPAPTAFDNCGVTVGTDIPSGSIFPKGTTTVHALATDPSGRTATCSFKVTVNDTEPPAISCPASLVTSTDPGVCSAVVAYPAPTASDNCGVTVGTDIASGSVFPQGTTPVHATATDPDGHTAVCSFNVTVNDTEPPAIVVTLDPAALWPPNHQMIPVTATLSLSDNCGAASAVLTAVTSSEPDDAVGTGDGKTVNDVQNAASGTPDFTFDLRSERAGSGQGRVYTATYTATDSSGNAAVAAGTSFVPHDHDGIVDPLSLTMRMSGGEAVLSWTAVPDADNYSVIRGDQAGVGEQPAYIDLGQVDCLASGTGGTSLRDGANPGVDQVFFYLVAYHHGQTSTYGAPSASKPRVAAGGNCP
ncbi:MAG TPA: HYR domain-containing protein [Patescibacteria group bacterium]|nr:HYR domain-containing protein [Patescibacteria group bacterium]